MFEYQNNDDKVDQIIRNLSFLTKKKTKPKTKKSNSKNRGASREASQEKKHKRS